MDSLMSDPEAWGQNDFDLFAKIHMAMDDRVRAMWAAYADSYNYHITNPIMAWKIIPNEKPTGLDDIYQIEVTTDDGTSSPNAYLFTAKDLFEPDQWTMFHDRYWASWRAEQAAAELKARSLNAN